MRAEIWMDRTPVPRKTPLQQAQADMRYWNDRIETLTKELMEAQHSLSRVQGRQRRAQQAALIAAQRKQENTMRAMTTAEALRFLLDQVDYTKGNCGPTEMVGAVLDKSVIEICRDALASAPPVLTGTD